MRNILVGLSSTVMIAFTIYRAFTTIVIMPFVSSFGSASGIYSLLFVLLAAGITALSFTRRRGVAASLASALCFVALFYWWVVICRASVPIWSDFLWLVLPEVFFSLAGLCKWLVGRPQSRQAESQASAA
jgi:hypothetical protein